jgi:hypothetical protein
MAGKLLSIAGKLLSIVAAAALLALAGAANAKDPVKLISGQLDKVTAGAINTQLPINAALFANGSSGPGGVNQFPPATATVTQTNIPTALTSSRFTKATGPSQCRPPDTDIA